MKTNTILFWIFTLLFAALMLFSGITNFMLTKESIDFVGRLGYPTYFIRFIGLAKILGAIAILIPGFPRIKEWAYAGLFFDLVAAIYSLIAIGDPVGPSLFLLLPIALGALSYIFYHKKISHHQKPASDFATNRADEMNFTLLPVFPLMQIFNSGPDLPHIVRCMNSIYTVLLKK